LGRWQDKRKSSLKTLEASRCPERGPVRGLLRLPDTPTRNAGKPHRLVTSAVGKAQRLDLADLAGWIAGHEGFGLVGRPSSRSCIEDFCILEVSLPYVTIGRTG
jgi:hypothetical protein